MISLFNYVFRSYPYKWLCNKVHFLIVKINPQYEMQRCYYSVFSQELDLKHPKDLIAKIYWMQLNVDTSLWTKCADKYLVRDYINDKGLSSYLPKLLGKWDCVNDIDFLKLPKEFVLKVNNGCEACYIVRDKNEESFKHIKKVLKRYLSLSFGYSGAQLHYTRIQPCIIAEELLHQNDELNKISPKSMIDYKIWCFAGKPECVFIVYNRQPGYINIALYDIDWQPMPEKLVNTAHIMYKEGINIPKPSCLSEMLKIASILSKDFSEVRIDFYIVNNSPVIGELTFTTGYGYFTKDYYEYLGSKVDLLKINIKNKRTKKKN